MPAKQPVDRTGDDVAEQEKAPGLVVDVGPADAGEGSIVNNAISCGRADPVLVDELPGVVARGLHGRRTGGKLAAIEPVAQTARVPGEQKLCVCKRAGDGDEVRDEPRPEGAPPCCRRLSVHRCVRSAAQLLVDGALRSPEIANRGPGGLRVERSGGGDAARERRIESRACRDVRTARLRLSLLLRGNVIGPQQSENVIGDDGAQAVPDEDDALVLIRRRQLADQSNAPLANFLARTDIAGCVETISGHVAEKPDQECCERRPQQNGQYQQDGDEHRMTVDRAARTTLDRVGGEDSETDRSECGANPSEPIGDPEFRAVGHGSDGERAHKKEGDPAHGKEPGARAIAVQGQKRPKNDGGAHENESERDCPQADPYAQHVLGDLAGSAQEQAPIPVCEIAPRGVASGVRPIDFEKIGADAVLDAVAAFAGPRATLARGDPSQLARARSRVRNVEQLSRRSAWGGRQVVQAGILFPDRGGEAADRFHGLLLAYAMDEQHSLPFDRWGCCGGCADCARDGHHKCFRMKLLQRGC